MAMPWRIACIDTRYAAGALGDDARCAPRRVTAGRGVARRKRAIRRRTSSSGGAERTGGVAGWGEIDLVNGASDRGPD
jgi:hypothetical protein